MTKTIKYLILALTCTFMTSCLGTILTEPSNDSRQKKETAKQEKADRQQKTAKQ